MILWLLKRYAGIKPVIVDGILYVLIAVLAAMELTFNQEETYKYINVYFLYWTKQIVAWLLAGVTALKMFRSTSYSDHLVEKSKEIKTNETKTT